MFFKSTVSFSAALLGALAVVAPINAQTTTAPAPAPASTLAPAIVSAPVSAPVTASEAAAMALLDKSAATYAALDGLSMNYTSLRDVSGKISSGGGTLAFDKSGRVLITLAPGQGRAITSRAKSDAILAQKAIARAMGRAPFSASVPLYSLVQGKNPLRDDTGFGAGVTWKEIRLLPNGEISATAAPKTAREGGIDLHFTFVIDPGNHLLRGVTVKAQIKNTAILDSTTLSDISINPKFAEDAFVAPKVALLPEEIFWDPKLVEGVAPYALTGPDLDGKPRDLAQYKGKVVLLDFWATWCGPCVAELPNVVANYAKFHDMGFEVVGISLDAKKASLTDFIEARKIPWPQLFDGKYWQNENAKRYGVRAIPFTLLIGKDGKIAAINPVEDELEPAIQAALAK